MLDLCYITAFNTKLNNTKQNKVDAARNCVECKWHIAKVSKQRIILSIKAFNKAITFDFHPIRSICKTFGCSLR